jgi:uncharacterized protein (TIGR02001 family)
MRRQAMTVRALPPANKGGAMKKVLFTSVLVMTALPSMAFAQEKKPEPEYTLAGNAGLWSDYRYRGFTQTDYKPALQGGVDFTHKSGFYLGNWDSNVSSVLYNGASLEMDFYGGYKTSIGPFGLDVGAYYYYYPGTGKYDPNLKIDYTELYVGGSYGPVSLKYWYGVTNYFGIKQAGTDTKGSQYLDGAVSFDLGSGFGVNGHLGWQQVKNLKKFGAKDDAYLDYRVGVTYDLSGWVLGASVVGSDKKDFFLTTDGKEAGKPRPVISVTKTF